MDNLEFIKADGYSFFDKNFSSEFEKELRVLPKSARKSVLDTYREFFCSGWYSCVLFNLDSFLSSIDEDKVKEGCNG